MFLEGHITMAYVQQLGTECKMGTAKWHNWLIMYHLYAQHDSNLHVSYISKTFEWWAHSTEANVRQIKLH